MAKVNTIAASGALMSLASAGTFWMAALLTYAVVGPTMTDLEKQMHALLGALALVYMLGAVIGTVSQLGAFLQIPGLIIGLPVAWYLDFNPLLYVMYFVGFLGTSMLIAAIFLGYSRVDKSLEVPPFSRVRVWTVENMKPLTRPLPEGAAKTVLAVLLASAISASAVAGYSWYADVSGLSIELMMDGAIYGNKNIVMSVDGEEVYSAYVPYDPSEYPLLSVKTSCRVSAGSHLVEVDAWGGSVMTEGTIDTWKNVKVLPFTTEEAILTLGVGF